MNMKVVSMCLICAGALLTGCGNGGKKEAETSERKEKEAVVGSDKDEHGCIASAGYTWSEVQKNLLKLYQVRISVCYISPLMVSIGQKQKPDRQRILIS